MYKWWIFHGYVGLPEGITGNASVDGSGIREKTTWDVNKTL